MDLSRIIRGPLFYFTVKFFKNGHKSLEIYPFKDTDASRSCLIYPDAVVGGFADKNILFIHIIPVLSCRIPYPILFLQLNTVLRQPSYQGVHRYTHAGIHLRFSLHHFLSHAIGQAGSQVPSVSDVCSYPASCLLLRQLSGPIFQGRFLYAGIAAFLVSPLHIIKYSGRICHYLNKTGIVMTIIALWIKHLN